MVYLSPLIELRWLFISNSLAKCLWNDARMAWFFSCVLLATRVDESRLRLCCLCISGWILVGHLQALNTTQLILIGWQMDGVRILVFLFCFRADQFVLLCAIFKALLLREVHHSGCRLGRNETIVVVCCISDLLGRRNRLNNMHRAYFLLGRSKADFSLLLLYIVFIKIVSSNHFLRLPMWIQTLGGWILTIWGAFRHTLQLLCSKCKHSLCI